MTTVQYTPGGPQAAAVYGGGGLFIDLQSDVQQHDRQIAILEQHYLESK